MPSSDATVDSSGGTDFFLGFSQGGPYTRLPRKRVLRKLHVQAARRTISLSGRAYHQSIDDMQVTWLPPGSMR